MNSSSVRLSGTSALASFWSLQLVAWSAYGFALMLPWLGEYSIWTMLPVKVVIGGSGLLVSASLRSLYRPLLRTTMRAELVVVAVVAASIVAGVVWNTVIAVLLGQSATYDLGALGSLEGGVPRLGGAFYQSLVLFTWSLSYVTIVRVRGSAPHVTSALVANRPAPDPVGHDRLIARDGIRALVLQQGEIDWVEAAGDYVRVHAGGRKVLLRGTMLQYESELSSVDYVRIHRSTIVNVARVHEVVSRPNREYLVVLRDGTKLRASRTYADRLRAALGIEAKALP